MAGIDASDLATRLGRQAEAVCRRYLSAGRRQGNYWQVGDLRNTPGRSMFVRLKDSPKGPAGKFNDMATGEHGDLLDVIRETLGLIHFADVAEEARTFLSLPRAEPIVVERGPPAPSGSPEAARRLWAMSRPIYGTVVETYLRNRGITDFRNCGALRFHPHCWYRGDDDDERDRARAAWPAMIAAVRDAGGGLTGVHRTWLAPDGSDKAPLSTPRRAMGHLLGNGVRFGQAEDVMAAGEGIETTLSLRSVLPTLPMVAALSAAHLSALLFGPGLRRLYVASDDDPAGTAARNRLVDRAAAAGVEAIVLFPALGDFNDDLRHLGREALWARIRVQLAPEDVARFRVAEPA